MSSHPDTDDAIHPAFAAFLATLIVVGLGSLLYLGSSLFAPLLAIRRGLFAGAWGWLMAVPMVGGLCGLVAAPIYLLEGLARRPDTWKCSAWVYTWLLLAVFGWLIKTEGLSEALLKVIVFMPYAFYLHVYTAMLALVGVLVGEIMVGLWLGWLAWPASSRLWKFGAVLAIAVCLLQRCH